MNTTTHGTITLADGRVCAATKNVWTNNGCTTTTYIVSIPMRGAIIDRKATPKQAKTFTPCEH